MTEAAKKVLESKDIGEIREFAKNCLKALEIIDEIARDLNEQRKVLEEMDDILLNGINRIVEGNS